MKVIDVNSVYIMNPGTIESNTTAYGNTTRHSEKGSNEVIERGVRWQYKGQVKRTQSRSHSKMGQNVVGVEVSFEYKYKFGVPAVAQSEITAGFAVRYQHTWEWTDVEKSEEEISISWEILSGIDYGLIQPGWAKHCSTKVLQGDYRGDYTAVMKFRVEKRDFYMEEQGQETSLSYSTIKSQCRDIRIEDIPGGADTTDARNTWPDAAFPRNTAQYDHGDPKRYHKLSGW